MKKKNFKWWIALPVIVVTLPLIAASCSDENSNMPTRPIRKPHQQPLPSNPITETEEKKLRKEITFSYQGSINEKADNFDATKIQLAKNDGFIVDTETVFVRVKFEEISSISLNIKKYAIVYLPLKKDYKYLNFYIKFEIGKTNPIGSQVFESEFKEAIKQHEEEHNRERNKQEEEERNRQEDERRKQEEERNRQEDERRKQEEERNRQEDERRKQEEELRKQQQQEEEERNRQEELRKQEEEEKKRIEAEEKIISERRPNIKKMIDFYFASDTRGIKWYRELSHITNLNDLIKLEENIIAQVNYYIEDLVSNAADPQNKELVEKIKKLDSSTPKLREVKETNLKKLYLNIINDLKYENESKYSEFYKMIVENKDDNYSYLDKIYEFYYSEYARTISSIEKYMLPDYYKYQLIKNIKTFNELYELEINAINFVDNVKVVPRVDVGFKYEKFFYVYAYLRKNKEIEKVKILPNFVQYNFPIKNEYQGNNDTTFLPNGRDKYGYINSYLSRPVLSISRLASSKIEFSGGNDYSKFTPRIYLLGFTLFREDGTSEEYLIPGLSWYDSRKILNDKKFDPANYPQLDIFV
ncbi:hypothetical protein DA803_01290 [[Mycoplasma] phocae]|uniref:Lipoprotein n=1 Tax=[Mycoplasma] phocae TaxID=142651 RepID=A0A2Z5IQ26_9BACT|nr:hypothetical protein [[Mycoplasma] phocae]AXE60720.1 hypothetical protein DA803_01290 [[Mycoplasma] phocae]